LRELGSPIEALRFYEPLAHGRETCVPQRFGPSTALVRNWSSLFLNRMLKVVSDP
jgi:hypothetical protein